MRQIGTYEAVAATLDPELVTKSYPSGDFHRVYFGEILSVFTHE